MGYLKKKRKNKKRKMACPRSMTQKKRRKKNGHMKVQEKKEIYNNIAVPSCYPNKGERDS